ncbi:hypothetical protein [Xenorhabdus hominickii]|uniref:Uncharacterized protein n=1 Tax=Xenorhabdus hominickii TaxID=351679 RepID=A0A2G0Q2K2_XENHO|nr:hypothetical protein [Xenorhabdus hominickii]AOM39690.1 hypothetical protein A9255_03245 [Xenorhabdus hominickii]PHM53447.1 hypothetical protein Xhom_03445 [Xenorhabdus hominickii]
MFLTNDPFSIKKELDEFKRIVGSVIKNGNDINLMTSMIKQAMLYNLILLNRESLNNKSYVNGIIYDILNAIISIMNGRERYVHLNIRSMIEHVSRIALNKKYKGGDFDGTVRRKDFEFLKKEKNHSKSNWKYLHDCYIRSCYYIHSSPKADLNFTATFNELVNDDYKTVKSKQIINLHKIISSITNIFLLYFSSEVSDVFFRTQKELKFLLGNSLYKTYQEITL